MTDWIAVVPWKQGSDNKSRLRDVLDPSARMLLSHHMTGQVIACLSQVREIRAVHLLSPAPVPAWRVNWLPDEGQGLNRELAKARAQFDGAPFVVIHADLPNLTVEDVAALLSASATTGAAFAPDRHGQGTNAIALADARSFDFAFGPGSFARHLAQCADAAVVNRPGLAFDLDTPADLALASPLCFMVT